MITDTIHRIKEIGIDVLKKMPSSTKLYSTITGFCGNEQFTEYVRYQIFIVNGGELKRIVLPESVFWNENGFEVVYEYLPEEYDNFEDHGNPIKMVAADIGKVVHGVQSHFSLTELVETTSS